MKKVCVFCGSREGRNPKYMEAGRVFGEDIGARKLGLVYGGATIGVMGAIANGALSKNGKVWGVIPQSIVDLEIAHENIAHLEVVNSMHQRKERMYELSDVFVAMPGGMGTLDELFEILTWAQLKFHEKKIILFNLNGFFNHLIAHIEHGREEGFISSQDASLIDVANDFGVLWEKLDAAL